jgi:phosphoribosylanthranilate isomerase
MAHLKKNIVQVKAENNCLAHALIIATAKLTNDPNHDSHRKGWKIRLLDTTGITMDNGAGIPEQIRFQEHFHEYKIVLYGGLNCDNIIFEGQVESPKRLNLLYDDVSTTT